MYMYKDYVWITNVIQDWRDKDRRSCNMIVLTVFLLIYRSVLFFFHFVK